MAQYPVLQIPREDMNGGCHTAFKVSKGLALDILVSALSILLRPCQPIDLLVLLAESCIFLD